VDSGTYRSAAATRPDSTRPRQGPRDTEAKRALISGLTEAMVAAYDLPPEAVQVWIQETAPESWGQAGKLRGYSPVGWRTT
jgi:4-oxalocrotonate tautomerase